MLSSLLVGISTGAAAMKIDMEKSPKAKNRSMPMEINMETSIQAENNYTALQQYYSLA